MRKILLHSRSKDKLPEQFARELNPAQLAAATAPDGPSLILAGPGSGKTRVITYRVAHLLSRGVPADAILLVTFTRRAAREMVGRLEALIGPEAARVWAGTFHHVGNRFLRQVGRGRSGSAPTSRSSTGEDQADLIRLAMDDAGLFGSGKMTPSPRRVLSTCIGYAFNVDRPHRRRRSPSGPPNLLDWAAADRPGRRSLQSAIGSSRRTAWDYDDLLGQWVA